jgi:N-acetylglutamate synthase-like GNAT family acetyltransferase
VEIRSAEDDDYPGIMQLLSMDAFVVRHTPYTYWVLKQISPESMLVSITDDQVCGFLAGVSEFQHPTHSLLLQIVVGDIYRRGGVGTSLVAAFVDRMRRIGREIIILTINSDNKTSESFFRSFAEAYNLTFELRGTTGNLGGILEEERVWELSPRRRNVRNQKHIANTPMTLGIPNAGYPVANRRYSDRGCDRRLLLHYPGS